MLNKRIGQIELIHFIADFVLINFAFYDAYYLRFGSLETLSQKPEYTYFVLYFNITWFGISMLARMYRFNPIEGVELIIRKFLAVIGLHLLLSTFFVGFVKTREISRLHLVITYCILFFVLLSWKLVYHYFLKFYKYKATFFKKVLIIGKGETSIELANYFQEYPETGYRLMGFFDNRKTPDILGNLEDLRHYLSVNEIDEIFFSLPDLGPCNLRELIEFADNKLIRVKLLPDLTAIGSRNIKINMYESIPIVSFRNIPLDETFNRMLKRGFDLVFSSLVIVGVLSWLYPIIALIIKLSSPGPVLFRQKRTGKDNQDFWCLKFRSMRINKDSDLLQATRHDKRITSIGRFLRKTNLDEFPQFINVFTGNMSIVGPRPHMLKHTEEYSQIISKYMVRHFVKPGITGLAQIKGYRGETNDPNLMKARIKIDIFYIENWSFLLDLKIIYFTVWNIVKGEENAF